MSDENLIEYEILSKKYDDLVAKNNELHSILNDSLRINGDSEFIDSDIINVYENELSEVNYQNEKLYKYIDDKTRVLKYTNEDKQNIIQKLTCEINALSDRISDLEKSIKTIRTKYKKNEQIEEAKIKEQNPGFVLANYSVINENIDFNVYEKLDKKSDYVSLLSDLKKKLIDFYSVEFFEEKSELSIYMFNELELSEDISKLYEDYESKFKRLCYMLEHYDTEINNYLEKINNIESLIEEKIKLNEKPKKPKKPKAKPREIPGEKGSL